MDIKPIFRWFYALFASSIFKEDVSMDTTKFPLILLMVFIAQFGFSQISGHVIDAGNSEPLEYATVALYKRSDSTLVTGVVTDIAGKFLLQDIPNGTYYLSASFLGYNSKTIDGIILSDTSKPIDLGTISLDLGTELNEVVIQSERATFINKIDRQVFDTKSFSNSEGGSATDILKNLPSASLDGQGNLNVRGVSGFVILLNGKPVQGDAMTIINQLPANAIARVELVTAPSAKYDPEGKAGLVNIITKKGALNGAFTQINVRGGFPSIEPYDNDKNPQRYGIDATYSIKRDKWNLALGASFQRNDVAGRRVGDVFTIINDTLTRFPSSGERSFDETNYTGRMTLDYAPDSTNVFSFAVFAGKRSKDRLADIVYYDNHALTPAENGNRLYTLQYFNHNLRIRKSDFALGSLDYSHRFRNNAKLSSSFLYEYTLLGGPTTNDNLGYPNTNIVYQKEYNTNDNPLNGIRFQVDYQFQPLSFGQLETGYQYRKLDHKGDFIYERKLNEADDFELVPEFSSKVDLKRSIHSGYLQVTGKKQAVDYALGLRLEHMDRDFDLKARSNTIDTTYVYAYTKLFPSASLRYQLSESSDVSLAYSKRVQRTTTFKMNPFPEREHSETLEQGDPTLLPEFIDLIELGYTHDLKKGNTISATAYYRDTKNVVNRVNTIYNDSILNRIYSNVGKSNSLGLEVGSQIKVSEHWSNFIGANLYTYRIDGQFDNRPIASKATVYSVNATSTYKFWKNASLQFTFNYLSDQNTAQGQDSRFYSPNLSFQKSFLDKKLLLTLQWQHMDLGLLKSNEQRITTFRTGEFYTTTNYVYEVDVVVLNLSYTFNKTQNNSKFIKSEFGDREF